MGGSSKTTLGSGSGSDGGSEGDGVLPDPEGSDRLLSSKTTLLALTVVLDRLRRPVLTVAALPCGGEVALGCR